MHRPVADTSVSTRACPAGAAVPEVQLAASHPAVARPRRHRRRRGCEALRHRRGEGHHSLRAAPGPVERRHGRKGLVAHLSARSWHHRLRARRGHRRAAAPLVRPAGARRRLHVPAAAAAAVTVGAATRARPHGREAHNLGAGEGVARRGARRHGHASAAAAAAWSVVVAARGDRRRRALHVRERGPPVLAWRAHAVQLLFAAAPSQRHGLPACKRTSMAACGAADCFGMPAMPATIRLAAAALRVATSVLHQRVHRL
mmetsp:Transcript_8739/g.32232  ORF Transcript_8739/g.32232 Transcript_8739/m.32232 type:complete len:258 (-) Transcript_8739:2768-3541(-)|eukprot:scaffold3111_cov332-Prasinococcus_capsulatus_cf.AAC.6